MKFPEEIALPTELIQRITVYNSIIAGIMKDYIDDPQGIIQ